MRERRFVTCFHSLLNFEEVRGVLLGFRTSFPEPLAQSGSLALSFVGMRSLLITPEHAHLLRMLLSQRSSSDSTRVHFFRKRVSKKMEDRDWTPRQQCLFPDLFFVETLIWDVH